jgi:hypothetical protein
MGERMRSNPSLILPLILLAIATPLAARDSLGVFGDWGAFRDTEVPRCYAIAAAEESRASRDFEPFASVGTWPQRQVRGQVHFQLSRNARPDSPVTLRVGRESFRLQADGNNAWAPDAQADAQIIAAIRGATAMQVRARDSIARRFTDSYSLEGAATALDAATLACSRRN